MTESGDASPADDVRVEGLGTAVVTVLINRPWVSNALRPETARRIEASLRELREDPRIRVVLLRGAGGRTFCGGYDLTAVGTGVRDDELQSMLRVLRSMPMPTVAVLDGHAVGAGLDLAASCDLRIVRAGSRIGLPAVRIGVAYDAEGLRRMVHSFPSLRRILLTGEIVEAAEVGGFADRIATADEFEEAIVSVAESLATASPASLSYMTAMTRPSEALDVAAARRWRDQILDGPDPTIAAEARGRRDTPVFPDREVKVRS